MKDTSVIIVSPDKSTLIFKSHIMNKKNLLKTYLITWYGPFHSIEETEEYQRQQDICSCLYLLQGKKPNAKLCSYYCGKTKKRTVPNRLKDKDHPINEILNCRSIWIGAFENYYKEEDIDIAEKMFIYLLAIRVDVMQLINDRCRYFSAQDHNMFLISRWYNPKRYKQPEHSIKLIIPETVAYFAETDEVKIARRLHNL